MPRALGIVGGRCSHQSAELATVVFAVVDAVFVAVVAGVDEAVEGLAVVWALATAAIAVTLKIKAVRFMISLLSNG